IGSISFCCVSAKNVTIFLKKSPASAKVAGRGKLPVWKPSYSAVFPLPCHYGLPLGCAWIQDGGEDAVDSPDGRPIFHISARNGASMPVLMSNLTARSPNMRVIQGM